MNSKYLTFCLALALAGFAPHQSNSSELATDAGPAWNGRRNDFSVAMNQIDGATSQVCPSNNFDKFFRAFADSASLQRQFTRMPIERGQLHAYAIGIEHEYELTSIKTFERLPSFDAGNGGVILPDAKSRTRGKLLLAVEPENSPEDPEYPTERKARGDRIVKLFIDDTGFHIYYRFQKVDGCWFLRAIHDKST